MLDVGVFFGLTVSECSTQWGWTPLCKGAFE
jgi:hypothetical protein